MNDPTPELLQAMAEVGLRPETIQWDGRFHRFPGIGQEKGDNGWYKAFVDQRGAIFGDWRTKEQWTWPRDSEQWKEAVKHLKPLSAAEVEKRRKEADAARAKAEKRDTKNILDLWERAKDCKNHPYLEAKGIRNVSFLKSIIDPETEKEMLLIPMRNADRKIRNIQRIWPDGRRRQMPQAGGSVGLYNTIGAHRYKDTKLLYICEGWATGWTIHMATSLAVIVAFFDGGLKTVGKIIREKYPEARLIFAADNDRWKLVKRGGEMVNPGVYAARQAAEALNAEYCIPDFPALETKPTDYDDLRQLEDLDAVRKWLKPSMAQHAETRPPGDAKEKPEREEAEIEPEPNENAEPQSNVYGKEGGEEDDDAEAYVPRRELGDLQQRYMSDPTALAHRLLDRMASKILIVDQNDGDTGALMMLPSGRWTTSFEPWRRKVLSELLEMITEVAEDFATPDKIVLANARRRTNRIQVALRHIDRTAAAVRKAVATAWRLHMKPHRHNATFDCPRSVSENILDADLNVLGFKNGVVDLRTGKLLDPVSGADRFITCTTGIRFEPSKAPQADILFEHLDEDLRTYFIESLAWILRGKPSRRINLVVGERNSGKTTVASALAGALGPDYAQGILPDALQKKHRGDAAHRGIAAFGRPCRLVTVEEPATGRLDTSLLKVLSGGGNVTTRKLYKDPITIAATASLVIFSNPGTSVPRLGLADKALADRVRELPYPQVPREKRDPRFLTDTVQSEDFREALAARLVLAGTKLTGPPSAPDAVQNATQRRLELDLSPLEEFVRRIVPGNSDDFLASRSLWGEWCRIHRGKVLSDPKEKVGGFSRLTFSMAISKQVPDIGKRKYKRIDGNRESGWSGWRLSIEPASG